MKNRFWKIFKFAVIASVIVLGIAVFFLPDIGAALLLHPFNKPVRVSPPAGCENIIFKGDGVELDGWMGKCQGNARGTIIYLHGVADNRASGAGICERFLKAGFDVIAYDSRAHGDSEGQACTYGFHEKRDLLQILAKVEHPPVVLLGSSMGAAVALQAAASNDKRIATVIAAETFSDLETIARERTPSLLQGASYAKAVENAEIEGKFILSEVSPLKAAGNIRVPVMIIHGEKDVATPPWHSRKVYDALQGPKTMILVPDAGHGQSLRGTVWNDIDSWISKWLPR